MMKLTTQDHRDLHAALRIVAAGQGRERNVLDQDLFVSLASVIEQSVDLWSDIHESDARDKRHIVVARPNRQVAHSINLHNFLRDPIQSGFAVSQAAFAVIYTPEVLNRLPLTFPGFLIGVTFAILRAFAQPIGYGEASLLHEMMRRSHKSPGGFKIEELEAIGPALVGEYQYEKGANSNEVRALVRSLLSWKAVEVSSKGYYRPVERVVFTRSQSAHWKF